MPLSAQRKTAAAVRFRDDTILYGDDALATQIRNPPLTFVHLRQMLGWGSAPASRDARSRGGAAWFEQEGMPWYSWLEAEGRGTLRVTSCCPHLCVSAEELNAILLAHLSDRVAATLAEERGAGMARHITDVRTVVAVPPWWGPCERAALRDAAMIGGVGGGSPADMELVDSHAALAFKFLYEWSLREGAEPTNAAGAAADAGAAAAAKNLTALLIDVGSTAVTASVVTLHRGFQSVVHRASVEAVAWEPTIGGSSFDELLANILRERYASQLSAAAAASGGGGSGGNSGSEGLSSEVEELLSGARASATLLREGKRVKEVLSASAVAYITLEGLPMLPPQPPPGAAAAASAGEGAAAVMMEGVLRTNITRVEFEQACAALVARAVAPVGEALRRWARLQQQQRPPEATAPTAAARGGGDGMQVLQSVQLVGGGSRVPAVQEGIRRVLQSPWDQRRPALPLQQQQAQQRLALGAELNADEAMAHGAAMLAVAKHSPLALPDGRILQAPTVASGAVRALSLFLFHFQFSCEKG